jgi:cell division protein FtsQ
MVKKKRRPKFNKRKKTLREKIKPLAISFAVLSIIGLIVWGVLRVMESPFLKAKITWEIDTKLPITQAVLKESVHALTNNKYQFDTDKIKQLLEFQPWVAQAHITKKWLSNDIKIKIKSQQIAMRWENNACKKKQAPHCTGYISNNGELFSPQKTVKSAAPLARSKANPTIVMQLYQDYQNYQKQAGWELNVVTQINLFLLQIILPLLIAIVVNFLISSLELVSIAGNLNIFRFYRTFFRKNTYQFNNFRRQA